MLDHDEILRLYGPWRDRTPRDAVELLNGYEGRWWIAGGWAIEAFTDVPRQHDDLDLSIPRSDVVALHQHLRGQLDIWQATQGALRPMIKGTDPVPPRCGNLWLRRSGAHPWEYDVLLMDFNSTTWLYKRDSRISLPLTDVLWTRGGISYLRPEVQLLHKAPGLRQKDQADFDACVRLLDSGAREWLRSALRVAHPNHVWLERL